METKKLVTKLINIMSSINGVAKSGHNTHQNYKYVTEADVLEAVRNELTKQKVFVFTSIESCSRVEQITTVQLLHTFVDSESGETFQVKSAGEGWDKNDKAIYKAITGAMKYFLTKNFLLPGEDDPENDNQTVQTTAPKTFGTVSSTEPKKGFTFGSNSKSFTSGEVKFTNSAPKSYSLSNGTPVNVQVTSSSSEGKTEVTEVKEVDTTKIVSAHSTTTTPLSNGVDRPKFVRRPRPTTTETT